MKKLMVLLLLATCSYLPLSAQKGTMVKNYTGQKIAVQVGMIRLPLESCDSARFKMEAGEDRLLHIQFINEKKDTCVFRKIISAGKTAIITKRDLKRYKHFYLPEKNGKPTQ